VIWGRCRDFEFVAFGDEVEEKDGKVWRRWRSRRRERVWVD